MLDETFQPRDFGFVWTPAQMEEKSRSAQRIQHADNKAEFLKMSQAA